MLVRFKKPLMVAVVASLLTLGVASCDSSSIQPTTDGLQAHRPSTAPSKVQAPTSEPKYILLDPAIALDQERDSQLLLARMADISASDMLRLSPDEKMEVAARVACAVMATSEGKLDGVVYFAAGAVASVYSDRITAEKYRVNDSLRDMQGRVFAKCKDDATDKW